MVQDVNLKYFKWRWFCFNAFQENYNKDQESNFQLKLGM